MFWPKVLLNFLLQQRLNCAEKHLYFVRNLSSKVILSIYRNAKVAHKLGQVGPKWDNIAPSQNVLKLIFKTPRFFHLVSTLTPLSSIT